MNTSDKPGKPNRRSIRVKGYNYRLPGAYFVTIRTYDYRCIFGKVIEGEVCLSKFGLIADECWYGLIEHFPNIQLDEYVVMPNHIHGIIEITDVRAQHAAPVPEVGSLSQDSVMRVESGSLGSIVRSFKSAVTRRINILRCSPGSAVWHRNYYEHIIRNERKLNAIRNYIINNPIKWKIDSHNPYKKGKDHV